MRIENYRSNQKELWDAFVRESKNGTFLFFRDYMDYSNGRFVDHSLLVWDDKDRLVALLPANREGNVLVSHSGLTYGGFLTTANMKAPFMLMVFDVVLAGLREHGFTEFIYKTVPHIYHSLPAEEDLYALFRCGAHLYRRDLMTTFIKAQETRPQERRLRMESKARKHGVTVSLSHDYASFWPILEYNLSTMHNLKSVHSLEEMRRLHFLFPDNIKLFGAFLDNEMVAGTVIYESAHVAHAQYIASSETGRGCGALDMLFFHLLRDVYKDKRYFDFGISTEAEGSYLNHGLVDFKEGFGGRTIMHDFYRIDLQCTRDSCSSPVTLSVDTVR